MTSGDLRGPHDSRSAGRLHPILGTATTATRRRSPQTRRRPARFLVSSDGWRGYLERFHADAPGVTERMLLRSLHDGIDPYRWAAAAVSNEGTVVDVACGSAPLAGHLDHARYLGIDRSAAELGVAVRRGVRVVRADATAVPVADGDATTVTCLMALMLIQPLDAVVGEVRRMLTPGGRLVALLPARLPGGVADALRWGAVMTALGEAGLTWPNPHVLKAGTGWLGDGLTIVDDETRTFDYPIDGTDDAEQFIASLYLPGVSEQRRDRAQRVVDGWIGRRIGVPLRRIVARGRP